MRNCSGCSDSWSGTKFCHCVLCHKTFSVERHFDSHRVELKVRGNTHKGPMSKCVDPKSIGLIENSRGTWKAKGEEDIYERLRGDTSP